MDIQLFPWQPDWTTGFLVGFAGLVGALITVFVSVGGAIPGTAGKAKLDAGELRLDRYEDRLEALTQDKPMDSQAVDALQKTVNNLRDDLRSERWRQFLLAGFLYAALGTAVALVLTGDVLQAFVVGAGWTGFLGSLGLKSDQQERRDKRDETLVRVEQQIDDLATAQAAGAAPPPVEEQLSVKRELKRDIAFARAL